MLSPDLTSQKTISTKAEPSPLKVLTELVKSDFDRVNNIILENLQSEIELIPRLASHLIQSGGKRIRPLLTLVSSKLCSYSGNAHLYLAAAVEFIHTATLLHDDVVDESALRRGKPSANSVWGNQASVLVGDFLFSRSFQLMVKADSMKALKSLSNAAAVLAEGEVMQLVDTGNLSISEDRYFDIIKAKTATLFESACEVGGMISNAPDPQLHALKHYGSDLGVCFQVIDDVMDYEASMEDMGKASGDDLREKKITLPIIYAYHHGTTDQKQFIEKIFQETYAPTDQDFRDLRNILDTLGAISYAKSKAESYASQAQQHLSVFPKSEIKDQMIDLVAFAVDRKQ